LGITIAPPNIFTEGKLTVTTVTCNDRVMSSRKAELLDAALAYLTEHGVANASLRPIAAALGTSPRILMFHFRSKEGLLQDVFEELQSRLQASLKTMASSDSNSSRIPPLRRFWQWATSKENFPFFCLLYEAHIVAIQNPQEYGRYLRKASGNWLAAAFDLMSPSLKSRAMASLCIAVFDGLMLELMSGGDIRHLTEALDLFISMATKASPTRKSRRSDRKLGRAMQ
jgi:AcrR family transcriptional regulator